MKKKNNRSMDFSSNKLSKYSIRKFTVGTSSILIGSLVFLGNPTEVEAEETKQLVSKEITTEAPTEEVTTKAPTEEVTTK
ncbi:YSIRK-type signal peptide-containing protein, partial [Macrococcus caseolyticus]